MVDSSSTADSLDPLQPIFAALRMQGLVLATLELSRPWGLRMSGFDDVAFYFIARGGAFVEHGGNQQAVETGDLVIVTPREPHVWRDHPRTRAVPFRSLEGEARRREGRIARGADPSPTLLLCGCFRFADSVRGLLLSCLPAMVHLRASDAEVASQHVMSALAAELRRSAVGREAITLRLAEALFLQYVRACTRERAGSRGWLRALGDERIGRALTAFHVAIDRDWTVSSLADQAAMSRSSFAQRFSGLIGEPPLAYMQRWRMAIAKELLDDASLSLKTIAARVGYGSDEAFSRAFHKLTGDAPGRYRARRSKV